MKLLVKCENHNNEKCNEGRATKCSKCGYIMEDLHCGELYEGSMTNVEEIKYCPHCGVRFTEIKYLILDQNSKKSVFDNVWDDDYFDEISTVPIKGEE